MRTITQVAEDLNVSRKKIYNDIEKLNVKTIKDGKNNFIEDKDFLIIKGKIQEQTDYVKERTKTVLERDRNVINGNMSDREYTNIKDRLEFLEEQIKVKDEQLKEQLQAKDEQIQAKDYQINGLIQSNFNFSKALNPPLEEIAVTKETKEVKKNIFSRIFGSGNTQK